MSLEVDRISYLPEPAIESILLCLSIPDLVRTSVLSSQWRNRWTSLSELRFNNSKYDRYFDDYYYFNKDEVVNMVDHVLLLHDGPLYTFELSLRSIDCFPEINRWIIFVSRKKVRSIIIEIWAEKPYKLPSQICSPNLYNLDLYNCTLPPAPTFKGFTNLRSLYLDGVSIYGGELEELISNCPLLNVLRLINTRRCSYLHINAPKLQYFEILGKLKELSFGNMKNLLVVVLDLTMDRGRGGDKEKFSEFLGSLPVVEKLETGRFLEHFVIENVADVPPLNCAHLKRLSVEVKFKNPNMIMSTLWLFKCLPSLEELWIQSCDTSKNKEPAENILETDYFTSVTDFLFKQLKYVTFTEFSAWRVEMDMIRFLLVTSPLLEKMKIKYVSADEGTQVLKELLQFRRASAESQIFFENEKSRRKTNVYR